MLVFVYGTLLRGEANHGLLAGAKLLGAARTEAGYALVHLGAYPGLVREGTGAVVGELVEVDAPTLARLDELESVPTLYRRETVRLEGGGEAATYVYAADPPDVVAELPRVAGGDWRRRSTS